jgi:OOP family OmpA-OmpF porin
MKIILLSIAILLTCVAGHSQTVTKKVTDRAKQRADTKVDQGIDKGLDKAENAIGNLFKKKKKKAADPTATENSIATNPDTKATGTTPATTATTGAGTPGVNTFSDFVPGANALFTEKFEQDALSDFPAQWNTNGSGKLVTIDGHPGKWLDIVQSSVVNPVLDKPLPENCTLEFDLFLQAQGNTPAIVFGLTASKDIVKEDVYYKPKFFVNIDGYNEENGHMVNYGTGLMEPIGNKNDFPLTSYVNKVLHISMAINKTRVRVYFDKTKLIDLPRILTPDLRNNFYICNYPKTGANLGVLISNIRIASAETDARSLLIKQLMEEGKAVTNDILFDVNSDNIKRESFTILNQFGEALKANPALRIKITGHTDSDGAAAHNLELSKQRAAAVKDYLLNYYSVDDSRIQIDGKGAAQPVAPNASEAGKAKNRRVEFVKL